MSLANTAVSGAIFFHMGKNSKRATPPHQFKLCDGVLEKRTIASVLPPYDDYTDALAAATPQSLGLESAAVGRARPAADGGVGGGFGATWRWE